jgi:hypothetical protein
LFHDFFGLMQDLMPEAFALRDEKQARFALGCGRRRYGRRGAESLQDSF